MIYEIISRDTDILRPSESRDPAWLLIISHLLQSKLNFLYILINQFNPFGGIARTHFNSWSFAVVIIVADAEWSHLQGWDSGSKTGSKAVGLNVPGPVLSSLTWYRLARWWLVLIKNGWFTPGWSTSWAAAANSPSMMSRGVRKLASC